MSWDWTKTKQTNKKTHTQKNVFFYSLQGIVWNSCFINKFPLNFTKCPSVSIYVLGIQDTGVAINTIELQLTLCQNVRKYPHRGKSHCFTCLIAQMILLQFYVPFYVKKKKKYNCMCLPKFECAKRLRAHRQAIPVPRPGSLRRQVIESWIAIS